MLFTPVAFAQERKRRRLTRREIHLVIAYNCIHFAGKFASFRHGSDEPILAGLRVIESSAFIAAPYAGMMLAQLGADVIRVDPPGGGLDYRRWPVTDQGPAFIGPASTRPSVRLRRYPQARGPRAPRGPGRGAR